MSDNFELLDETNPGLNLVSLGHQAPTHCSLQSLAGHVMVELFYCGYQPRAKLCFAVNEINTQFTIPEMIQNFIFSGSEMLCLLL